jgi:uncharacterized protein YkwD
VNRARSGLGVLALLAFLLIPGTALPSPAQALTNCSVSAGDLVVDGEEQQMLQLINSYRTDTGLSPLSFDPDAARAAAWFSRDMASTNRFPADHVDSLGRGLGTRLTQCGASYTRAGENIAAGNASAEATFEQWRNSSGHDANMLRDDVTGAGIGRAYDAGSEYQWYWTLDLTASQSAPTTTAAAAPTTTTTTTAPTTTTTTTTTELTTTTTTERAPATTRAPRGRTASPTTTVLTTSPTFATAPVPTGDLDDADCQTLEEDRERFNTALTTLESALPDSLSGHQRAAVLAQLEMARVRGNAEFDEREAALACR